MTLMSLYRPLLFHLRQAHSLIQSRIMTEYDAVELKWTKSPINEVELKVGRKQQRLLSA